MSQPMVPRRWLARPSYCPDKKCRPLVTLQMVEGGICCGKLAKPTDHIYEKINDMSFCWAQDKRHQWHFNETDAFILLEVIAKLLRARGTITPEWLIDKFPRKEVKQDGLQSVTNSPRPADLKVDTEGHQ